MRALYARPAMLRVSAGAGCLRFRPCAVEKLLFSARGGSTKHICRHHENEAPGGGDSRERPRHAVVLS